MMIFSKTKVRAIILVSVAFFISGVIFSAHAHSKTKPYNYLRIFYYREGKLARESLFSYPSSIDVLAPQSYSLDESGALSGGVKTGVLAFAKKHKIKVMPLVTNRNFSETVSDAILGNGAVEDNAIVALVDEAKKQNYWGWQFDFEQMDASGRDQYSAFIKKAAERFKQNNLILSVAAIAQVSENPSDYPNDLWQNLIGVYDYKALGEAADFVSIMSYDDPNSTGPVAQYPWLKRVLEYSVAEIPAEKLSMGIPLYYWQWEKATGKRVGIGGRKGIYRVLAKHKVTSGYDAGLASAYLTYWNKSKQYTIWYENAKSIAKKIELIAAYKLHGFSAWALGLELPSIFVAVKK